ncbi:uncharacterized protein I206_106201 [Kwoniella pini CBS 10737]|uniref:Uncharacterized protein n=1 Tax=Kwoniella pini CBS 10737 TaxID=1296096 RepID=A0A1B9I1F4_9TREE|nr:uncharacterized protein I206_05026 [Kwoniella pini CBS 10737]OCF49335.1 hypothetical protein I206_05026 [Kwoniella pini CBS 10737]
MSSSLTARPLFGGAISLDLPENYIDASDLRQIPDNQEVFLSSTSDTAIVLEVLGMVEDGLASTDLWEAVKFHFSSIAHDNASLESKIITLPPSEPIKFNPSSNSLEEIKTPNPIILSGTQLIHKFSHNSNGLPREGHENDLPDKVWIGISLWRIWIQDEIKKTKKKADLVLSINVNLSDKNGNGEKERENIESWFFNKCVKSLKIEDFNLFGDLE